MNTEARTTSPLENNTRKPSSKDNRKGGRIRAWAGRLRGAAASIAIAAVLAVGGAGMLTTQEAASAGVTQHNYAILTSTAQTQSSTSTPQNDKKPNGG